MGRSRVTDEQLREAAQTAQSLRQLLEVVGLVGRGGNYATCRARLLRLGITDARFQRRPPRREPTVEELARAAAAQRTVSGVCRALGLAPTGRTHGRVRDLLDRHGVDTSHFLGRGANLGRRDLPSRARPLADLLRPGSSIASTALRHRLLREGLLEPECSGCSGRTWRGVPMPLELDHVNGVRDDNRLVNLRLLCPNCHALTDTYRGRNIGRPS